MEANARRQVILTITLPDGVLAVNIMAAIQRAVEGVLSMPGITWGIHYHEEVLK